VAEPERRERLRYGLRSALKHGPAERRQQYYRQAFSRLSSDDRTFLKQARISLEELTLEQRFRRLADEWSRQTSTVSSVNALVSHPKYREIIQLGWSVVPYLLRDLQSKGDFWFPALAEITGIRPFDPHDAGKSRRMTAAWIEWGKKKGLI